MKFFPYIFAFVCAFLALAAGESLGRVKRSPAPIPDPGPDPWGHRGYWGLYGGYGRGHWGGGYGRGHWGGGYGYGHRGYGHGWRYGR